MIQNPNGTSNFYATPTAYQYTYTLNPEGFDEAMRRPLWKCEKPRKSVIHILTVSGSVIGLVVGGATTASVDSPSVKMIATITSISLQAICLTISALTSNGNDSEKSANKIYKVCSVLLIATLISTNVIACVHNIIHKE